MSLPEGIKLAVKTKADHRARIKGLKAALKTEKVDAILVSDINSARYLSGFTGSNVFMIITPREAFFLTDPRYTEQAKAEVRGCKIRIFKKAFDEIADIAKGLKVKTLGFEAANLNFSTYSKLDKALSKVKLKPTAGVVGKLRQRKDAFEIERLKASASLLDAGFKAAMRFIKPGAVEEEAAFSVEVAMRRRGAEALAFDTIIASGPRGALPHGKASGKKIKKGELVVVDMGVIKDGYNSDETRTFSVGRPQARQKEVYRIVKEAQAVAIDAVKAGVKASDVDAAARGYIEKAGYGKYFSHGTGHGTGLEIHEGPSISPISEDVLHEGMVITVEPGIYIPGWGGVRIEDMVLVKKGGCEMLTNSIRDLVIL
ncbi:MAG TPA: hypothetical protein DDW94_00510 [Deltaproteobacteria bacterium]|nr:hypothetical protein [Deltaproteobacteria bacterium]HCY10281.1 hypothetical protein [Deltaproteobacteria bacterium]